VSEAGGETQSLLSRGRGGGREGGREGDRERDEYWCFAKTLLQPYSSPPPSLPTWLFPPHPAAIATSFRDKCLSPP